MRQGQQPRRHFVFLFYARTERSGLKPAGQQQCKTLTNEKDIVIYPDFSFTERQKQTANASDTGVFSSFIENMQEGFSGIKVQINSIKDTVSSIATSTHYSVNNDDTTNTDSTTEVTEYSTTTEDRSPNL